MLAKYNSDKHTIFDPFYILSDFAWPKLDSSLHSRVDYDVTTDEKSLTLTIDLPGVKKEDLRVEAEGQKVTVKAKRGDTDFTTAYRLAKEYDVSQPDAVLENGVLTLKFNKTQTSNLKLIEVR